MALKKILLTLTVMSLGRAHHISHDDHGYSYVTRHDGHHHSDHGSAGHAGNQVAFNGHIGNDEGSSDGEDGGHYHHEDYHHKPKYSFEYGVKDHHTGDNKNHWEKRDGDVVKGGYTLHEPDGTKLEVEYTADKHSGFNAIVKRVGHAQHPHLYKSHHEGGSDDGGHSGYGGHGAVSYSNIHQHY